MHHFFQPQRTKRLKLILLFGQQLAAGAALSKLDLPILAALQTVAQSSNSSSIKQLCVSIVKKSEGVEAPPKQKKNSAAKAGA
jgi:hypothetical protein